MSIVDSIVLSNKPYGQANQRKVREIFTDHVGIEYENIYIAESDSVVEANLAEHAIVVNQSTIYDEIANGISECYAGGDPLHFDAGGWWDKVTPTYQTWEELMFGVSEHFLSQTDQLELQWWALSNSRISSSDKKRVWDKSQSEVSDVNSDVQIAIDTQESLEIYEPHMDKPDRVFTNSVTEGKP